MSVPNLSGVLRRVFVTALLHSTVKFGRVLQPDRALYYKQVGFYRATALGVPDQLSTECALAIIERHECRIQPVFLQKHCLASLLYLPNSQGDKQQSACVRPAWFPAHAVENRQTRYHDTQRPTCSIPSMISKKTHLPMNIYTDQVCPQHSSRHKTK